VCSLYFGGSKCDLVLRLPLPLVERSKEEIVRAITRRVERVKGVKGCSELNVRVVGKRFDVSMLVLLDSSLSFGGAHGVALDVEKEVKSLIPNSRVSVDTEPFGDDRESVWRLVKETAEGTAGSRGVHNIHVQRIDGKLCVDLHLEVSANMTVKEAHRVADQVEKRMKAADPDVSEVTVHIESASDRISRELAGIETELESYVEHVAKRFPEIKEVHAIRVRRFGDAVHLVLHCTFDSGLSIQRAHELSSALESAIKKAYPNVARIDIHEEPA
jgi:divalent metal cation (Fe/Co/Zn/Cd) transporter